MPAVVYAPASLQNYQIQLPNGTVLGAGTDVNVHAILSTLVAP